jgi:biotin carboxyl carrier protein
MVRREDFLDLKRITEFYREIPPANLHTSVEAYRKADLPGWEVASVLYEPKVHPAESLAYLAMDSIPDNLARAKGAFDGRRLELQGTVYYINRQLELLERMDSGTPASVPAGRGTPGGRTNRDREQPSPPKGFTVQSRNSGSETEQIDVRPLADGVVTQVHVRQGQQVKQGDLLVELDNAEIELELEAAKLRLKAPEDQLKMLERAAGEAPVVSQAELAHAARQAALAKLEVQRWELRLARTLIKAPAAGQVIHLADLEGRKVSAGEQILVLRPTPAATGTQPASHN